jgi:hypothetical protein
MSYNETSHTTTITTDKTNEELMELVEQKLNSLTNLILTKNEDELVKLEMGDELLDTFYDCEEVEEVVEGLKTVVKVVGNNINLSTNSEDDSYSSCFFPLTTLFAPLMNKEFVFSHTYCYDSREGMSGDVAIINKEGVFTCLNEDDITLK